MIRRSFLIILILGFSTLIVCSQTIISSSDLFKNKTGDPRAGQLNIIQDPALDTLMTRYIMANEIQEQKNDSGIEGFRIQIYNSSDRNAKVESGKIRQEFINQFPESQYPELITYQLFAEPAWYKVRVGNFRSRTEATRLYLIISKKFPN